MTEATVTCGMWRGITTPAGWSPPAPSDAMVVMFGKLSTKEGKEATKYVGACVAALDGDLSADGLTRDGKALTEAHLFLAMAEAYKEAKEAKEAAKVAAEKAAMEAKARALRMEAMGKAMADGWTNGTITWDQMLAWADIAHENGAYIVLHGGPDQGAGPSIRFKVEPKAAKVTTGAPRETGGGSKGGKETRVSAYAEAIRFQDKGGAPHNITRTGDSKATYAYLDHGKAITGPLSKYLQDTYPESPCAVSLRGYDERRKAANASA